MVLQGKQNTAIAASLKHLQTQPRDTHPIPHISLKSFKLRRAVRAARLDNRRMFRTKLHLQHLLPPGKLRHLLERGLGFLRLDGSLGKLAPVSFLGELDFLGFICHLGGLGAPNSLHRHDLLVRNLEQLASTRKLRGRQALGALRRILHQTHWTAPASSTLINRALAVRASFRAKRLHHAVLEGLLFRVLGTKLSRLAEGRFLRGLSQEMLGIQLVHLLGGQHLLRCHKRQLANKGRMIGDDFLDLVDARELLAPNAPVNGAGNWWDGETFDEDSPNLVLVPSRRDQANINLIGNHEVQHRLVKFNAACKCPEVTKCPILGHAGEISEQIPLGEREIVLIEAHGAAHRQRLLFRWGVEFHAELSLLGPNGTTALD
mmetsp:Transcript_17429/g.44466  ORF Transcript_17429/g.44466 Transcript_17429/m.44466 type:complete len:375 (+) Transcript_17429:97-1221(+)